jgi:starch synthase
MIPADPDARNGARIKTENESGSSMEILFVAAENGALPGGKVGGIGDVVRDLPPALAACGCRVTVAIPSHGFLHKTAGAEYFGACHFLFRGEHHSAQIHRIALPQRRTDVTHLVIHHPALSAGGGSGRERQVYAHDPADRPFFTDASRFALFSAAVAAALSSGSLGTFDVLHLHDWHAAMVLLLGRFHPDCGTLRDVHSVYSIHNLAYQGIRPLRGSDSSLEAWFPELRYDWATVADPRWHDCINPMAAGIRLADRVHTVSPAYAREILLPSRKPQFYGGEGLEADLARARAGGRLTGILNGCRYEDREPAAQMPFPQLLGEMWEALIRWCGEADAVPSAHFIAHARLRQLERGGVPQSLLTMVSRVDDQKILLLRSRGEDGRPGLHAVLDGIRPRGCLVMLGAGDPAHERFLTETASRYANFIFMNGFSEKCARALYAAGDLFLMPSSFEPCGLSQMLAMRAGQPCVVHDIGGLRDTVRDGKTGFAFGGATIQQQVQGFVDTTLAAVELKRRDPDAWKRMRRQAAACRFSWQQAAEEYVRALYSDAAKAAPV